MFETFGGKDEDRGTRRLCLDSNTKGDHNTSDRNRAVSGQNMEYRGAQWRTIAGSGPLFRKKQDIQETNVHLKGGS